MKHEMFNLEVCHNIGHYVTTLNVSATRSWLVFESDLEWMILTALELTSSTLEWILTRFGLTQPSIELEPKCSLSPFWGMKQWIAAGCHSFNPRCELMGAYRTPTGIVINSFKTKALGLIVSASAVFWEANQLRPSVAKVFGKYFTVPSSYCYLSGRRTRKYNQTRSTHGKLMASASCYMNWTASDQQCTPSTPKISQRQYDVLALVTV